jgi:hypothetical protein
MLMLKSGQIVAGLIPIWIAKVAWDEFAKSQRAETLNYPGFFFGYFPFGKSIPQY